MKIKLSVDTSELCSRAKNEFIRQVPECWDELDPDIQDYYIDMFVTTYIGDFIDISVEEINED